MYSESLAQYEKTALVAYKEVGDWLHKPDIRHQ